MDKAISDGVERGTKTGAYRSVRLLSPLRDDLHAWKAASDGTDGALVFPRMDGKPWTLNAWRNWTRRVYRPVTRGVGLDGSRPYDLRHSFASLLLREQKLGPVGVAGLLGHSVQTMLTTYAHEIEELQNTRRRDPAKLIADARARAPGSTRAASKLPHPP